MSEKKTAGFGRVSADDGEWYQAAVYRGTVMVASSDGHDTEAEAEARAKLMASQYAAEYVGPLDPSVPLLRICKCCFTRHSGSCPIV